jgi:CheY-like chemotaxis protein
VKILVADDDATIRKIAGGLLISAGYEVLEASDGEQALKLTYKEHPDLIVLDLEMQKMTGFDVVREIRKNPRVRKTPILIMSGVVPGDRAKEVLRGYGFDYFISKDNMTTSLVSLVQQLLSK